MLQSKLGILTKFFLNIVGYYRQWSRIFNNKPFESYTMKEQDLNFENQMSKINEISNSETVIIGDFNVDFKLLNKDEKLKNNYEKNFKKKE